jgi:hypothetical protein
MQVLTEKGSQRVEISPDCALRSEIYEEGCNIEDRDVK